MDTKDMLIGQVRSYLAASPVLPDAVKREVAARLAERPEEDLRALLQALIDEDKARSKIVEDSAVALEAQLREIRDENERLLTLFGRAIARARLTP